MGSIENSRWIYLKNDAVVYDSLKENLWKLPVGEIRVIGEFTNSAGPFLDDYFFVFLTGNTPVSQCYPASFYASGRDEFLERLGKRLGHKMTCELTGSTNFKSRVMWPEKLEGHPLFEILPEESAKNLVGRIRQKLLRRTSSRITKEVREVIESQPGHEETHTS